MRLTKDAVKSFEKGLAANPQDVECLLGLARAHLSTGASEQAQAALLKLVKVKPDHTEAQAHLAMMEAQAGNAAAVEKLKTLAAAQDAGFIVRYDLASVLAKHGDTAGAKAAYASALQVAPKNSQVHFELGRIALDEKDVSAAVAHFQKSAELAPREPMPLVMLSRAYLVRGELGRAVQAAQKAHELAPKMRTILEDLFKLFLAAKSAEGAIRAARELRLLDGQNANYVYMHGLATAAAGKIPEAKTLLQEALKLAPRSWQARHALAQVHNALKERAEALKLLEEALALAPTEPEPANDLAVLLMQDASGFAKARAVLEKVVAAHPEHAGVHLNLALSCIKADRGLAVKHAKQAQVFGSGDIQQQASKLLKQLGA
jgi:Flp pilus assembly protein TadD